MKALFLGQGDAAQLAPLLADAEIVVDHISGARDSRPRRASACCNP
jgi:hypothetical protein